jgi:hypothetical protein
MCDSCSCLERGIDLEHAPTALKGTGDRSRYNKYAERFWTSILVCLPRRIGPCCENLHNLSLEEASLRILSEAEVLNVSDFEYSSSIYSKYFLTCFCL